MATGFVQRFKGKINVASGGLWIGGVQVGAAGADLNAVTGWGTVSTVASSTVTPTLANGGVTVITSTALANGIYTLANPVAGRQMLLVATTGSTAWMVKASTGVVTIQNCPVADGGSSLTNTIKSTQATFVGAVGVTVRLVGLSSIAYSFEYMTPSTLGALLFSTTT